MVKKIAPDSERPIITYVVTDGDGNLIVNQDFSWDEPELVFNTLEEAIAALWEQDAPEYLCVVRQTQEFVYVAADHEPPEQ